MAAARRLGTPDAKNRQVLIDAAEQLMLEEGHTAVTSRRVAEKAGLKAGDIILKIDDKNIDQTNSLSALVNKHKVGDKITLTILRDGKEQKIDVTLGAAPTN